MIDCICLFFPAFLSLGVYKVLSRKPLSLGSAILRYFIYGLFVNLLGFALNEYLLPAGAYFPFVTGGTMGSGNGVIYLFSVAIIAVLLPVAEVLLSKKVSLTIEDDADENP